MRMFGTCCGHGEDNLGMCWLYEKCNRFIYTEV